jgi:hypothetical protein
MTLPYVMPARSTIGIYITVVPRLVRGIQAWLFSVALLLDTAHKARYDGCVDTYVEARWHDALSLLL